MLEQVLPIIRDPAEYIAALSLFRLEAPLTKEEADRLLEIYTKYLDQAEDPGYARLCLAVDLLPGRGRETREDFASLGLEAEELETLFIVKELLMGEKEMTAERAKGARTAVEDEQLGMAYRILLARVALDLMATSGDYMAMREEIKALAAFLTGCGEELLDKYTILIGEVRMKCRIR